VNYESTSDSHVFDSLIFDAFFKTEISGFLGQNSEGNSDCESVQAQVKAPESS